MESPSFRAADHRGTRILPCKFHQVLHRFVLVRPGFTPGIRVKKPMLLQYGRDGDGFAEMEGREVQEQDRELDGVAETEKDLRIGVVATVFAGIWWARGAH
ncbi:hypothetical protein HAX54_014413 [Datura stramonium]|uniref:Uncharacterized protein n=1 Tax=Datura stramonium TaxID=4076 RepID=A0ABS8TPX8_DATST|nr:hypothetical protein [Datura stramonium]